MSNVRLSSLKCEKRIDRNRPKSGQAGLHRRAGRSERLTQSTFSKLAARIKGLAAQDAIVAVHEAMPEFEQLAAGKRRGR